jgi:hypothetical protein
MRVTISWTTHARKYSIGLQEFLKQMGINVTEEQIKATARKLLEQNEVTKE